MKETTPKVDETTKRTASPLIKSAIKEDITEKVEKVVEKTEESEEVGVKTRKKKVRFNLIEFSEDDSHLRAQMQQ